MSDYTPVYTGGAEPFTMTTSAAVTGGNVVVWTGASTVAASSGVSTVVAGVAAHDAASGARVSIWPIDGVIHELVSSGAITAGGGIESAASGAVAAAATSIAASSAAGSLIGAAVTTAAGNKVRIQGRR
jgi:hypothetical protein